MAHGLTGSAMSQFLLTPSWHAIFVTFLCRNGEWIVHFKIILQEKSSGFILRNFSNWERLRSFRFLTTSNNSLDGLSIIIGSFVYDMTLLFHGAKIRKKNKRRSLWAVFFAKVVLFFLFWLLFVDFLCYFSNSDNNMFIRSRTLDFLESGCLIRKLSGSIYAFLLTSSIIDWYSNGQSGVSELL